MTDSRTSVRRAGLLPLLALLTAACSTPGPPLATVEYVDLERFMGDWYVIASIPTVLEKEAFNAVESYRLEPDGSIATTFTFRKGGFEGPEKVYTPRGFVTDTESNAIWGMQFVWPVKADYRITWLSPDYGMVVIARNKLDYVWIMARDPVIPESDYETLLAHVSALGYDTAQLRKVPQRW
jgi:apolipoprotein D and lipocalin family protein